MTAVGRLGLGAPHSMMGSVIAPASFQISQTNHKVGWIFQAVNGEAITRLGFRYALRTGTPPTHRISLQSIGSDGYPTGTILGGGSPASALFTPPADASWDATFRWITLDTPYVPTQGQLLGSVIEHASGTVSTSHSSSFTTGVQGIAYQTFPLVPASASYQGLWSRGTRSPVFGVDAGSSKYGFIVGDQFVTPTAGVLGHRQALKLSIPIGMASNVTVCGLRALLPNPGAGKTLKVCLWDGAGSALRSKQIDSDTFQNSIAGVGEFYFDSGYVLAAGTTYYIGVEVDDATAPVCLRGLQLSGSGDLSAYPFAAAWHLATWTGSAWVNDQTVRPSAELIVEDITQGTPLVPAVPTLAVADNGLGTGGVATITGADASASISLYSQTLDGDLGSGVWTFRGSRTGNGAINVALTSGYYWWKAVATLGGLDAISNLVYQNFTDGSAPVYQRCLEAVRSKIITLALDAVSSEAVVVKKVPLDRNLGSPGGVPLPSILITPTRDFMQSDEGVNARDDVIYGVLVTVVDRDNQESTHVANLERYLRWREQIARAFRQQRLPGVVEVVNCVVEPAEAVVTDAWTKNLYASSLLLKFVSREKRGMT